MAYAYDPELADAIRRVDDTIAIAVRPLIRADIEMPPTAGSHVVTRFPDQPSDPGPARTRAGKGFARLHERGPMAPLLLPAASFRKQWER